ncbi:copine-8 [Hyalella azteca]|uniref:Copine-8 n=1 Tax=Hyalella azteca TaxID=294128 RepID=A0A8B7NPW7_HYAAZ|nr:copine-8 [Hyalella azteca]
MAGGTAINPTSLIELTISCRNLRDTDVFSKSDPIAVLYYKPFATNKWLELRRTECISNTLNPDFVTKLPITYHFEEQQHLKFCIYDIDSRNPNLDNHDFLGEYECSLATLVSEGKVEKPLVDKGCNVSCGNIIIVAEEMSACREEMTIQFIGKNLVNNHWFGKISPFLEFYKANEDNSFTLVHRTEPVRHCINPVWKDFKAQLRSFCSGDYDRTIKVNCREFVNSGNHKLLGSFMTNVRTLLQGPGPQNVYLLIDEDKKKRKGSSYKPGGEVHVSMAHVQEVFSFIDYLKGGTDLNAFIAIDFTASNGNPQSPDSLHHIDVTNSGKQNQYQRAIQAVGEIIEDYDSDKYFPVLGFGARVPPDFSTVTHLFFVNGDATNPYCYRVRGVLDAYHSCLSRVQLYGPTNFAPIITHVAQFAAAHRHGDKYFILLILIVPSPEVTIIMLQAIVRASVLPLSIIIVGVGDADFSAMEELDGDRVRLSSGGQTAARDIVQFVPFRDFLKGGKVDNNTARIRLAREVLAEVPDQFMSFMRENSVKPGAAGKGPAPATLPMCPTLLQT